MVYKRYKDTIIFCLYCFGYKVFVNTFFCPFFTSIFVFLYSYDEANIFCLSPCSTPKVFNTKVPPTLKDVLITKD